MAATERDRRIAVRVRVGRQQLARAGEPEAAITARLEWLALILSMVARCAVDVPLPALPARRRGWPAPSVRGAPPARAPRPHTEPA